MLMHENYKAGLVDTALQALLLLDVTSNQQFLDAIKKEDHLLRLYEEETDPMFAAKIVDPQTGQLVAKFSEYLDTVFESAN